MYSLAPEEWATKIKEVIESAEHDGYSVFAVDDGYSNRLQIGYFFPEDDDIFIMDVSI